MTPSEHAETSAALVARYAADAGLSPSIAPAPYGATLADCLAANPFLMAPMAGVSDAAYRLMARAGGASFAYSEMVSVAGIHYGGEKTWELVDPDPAEPDIAVQLFGSEPAQFAEATSAIQRRLGSHLLLLDINMACPVPKVTRKGEGSALLDDPARAAEIVRSVRGSCDVPVTVKIRVGRVAGNVVAPDFARSMVDAGANAIAVHGRVASQFYRGSSDASLVAEVAHAVSVPVIGSGDVMDPLSAAAMIRSRGCAAAFVARGSYGNPWIFSDSLRAMRGETQVRRGYDQRLAAFCLHVRLLHATGAHMARARSLAGWYLRGIPNASSWRARAMGCDSVDDYLLLADSVRKQIECSDAARFPEADGRNTAPGVIDA